MLNVCVVLSSALCFVMLCNTVVLFCTHIMSCCVLLCTDVLCFAMLCCECYILFCVILQCFPGFR